MLKLRQRFVKYPLLAILLLLPLNGAAAEEEFSLPRMGLKAADSAHGYISSNFEETARRLDSFLGGTEALTTETGSYFVVRGLWSNSLGSQPSLGADLKLSLALPITQRLLRLEFDTKEEGGVLASDKKELSQTPGLTKAALPGQARAFAGLAADLLRESGWRARVGTGVRLNSSLDPYAKFVLGHERKLGENWRLELEEGQYWYYSEGFTFRALAVADRKVGVGNLFRSNSFALYTWDDEAWTLGETLTFFQPVDADHSMAYRAGILWGAAPVFRDEEYFLDISVRRRLHSDWLFAEVRSGIGWPRSRDFQPTPGAFITLEAFFGQR